MASSAAVADILSLSAWFDNSDDFDESDRPKKREGRRPPRPAMFHRSSRKKKGKKHKSESPKSVRTSVANSEGPDMDAENHTSNAASEAESAAKGKNQHRKKKKKKKTFWDLIGPTDEHVGGVLALHHHFAGTLGVSMALLFASALLMFPFAAEPRLREQLPSPLMWLFLALFLACLLAYRFLYHLPRWSKQTLAAGVVLFSGLTFTFMTFTSNTGEKLVGGNPYPYAAILCGLLHSLAWLLLVVVACLQEWFYLFSTQGIILLVVLVSQLEIFIVLLLFIPNYSDDKLAEEGMVVVYSYSTFMAFLTAMLALVMLCYVLENTGQSKPFFNGYALFVSIVLLHLFCALVVFFHQKFMCEQEDNEAVLNCSL